MDQLILSHSDMKNLHTQIASVWKQFKVPRNQKILSQKMEKLLELVAVQDSFLQEGIEDAQQAIEARNLTIDALGSKLFDLTAKNSEDFYVLSAPKEEPTENEDQPNLVRPRESETWSRDRAGTLENEILREMARLSLEPLGLREQEFEDAQEELAASLKFQRGEADPNEEDMRRALKIIQAAEENAVSAEQTKGFLRKKQLTDEQIEEAFERYSRTNSSENCVFCEIDSELSDRSLSDDESTTSSTMTGDSSTAL